MYEFDLALRHIRSHRRQTVFSTIAVALSVAIIIISMSLITGFTDSVLDATVENQAHIVVSPGEDNDFIYLYHGLRSSIEEQDVTAISSYYQGEAALQFRHNVEGAVLLGINP